MPRKAVLGALLVAALAVAMAGPAHAGGPESTLLKAKVARHLGGPYKSQVQGSIEPGDSRNFYLRVKNRTGESQPVEFTDGGDPPPYSAKFFKGSKNITDDVLGIGYEFNIPAKGVKKFRMKSIRAENPPGVGTCLRPTIADDVGGLSLPLAAIDRSILSCLV